MNGVLDLEGDSAECGYCGDLDGASVMAIDPDGEVSCWKCARDHGFFDWDESGEDDLEDDTNDNYDGGEFFWW